MASQFSEETLECKSTNALRATVFTVIATLAILTPWSSRKCPHGQTWTAHATSILRALVRKVWRVVTVGLILQRSLFFKSDSAMNVICITRFNAALYQMGAATKQAAHSMQEFSGAMVKNSKWFPKKDRRKIARMIRRGRLIKITKGAN